LKVIWGAESVIVPFVAGQIGLRRTFGECVTAAIVDETNNLAAGVVFHNYDPDSEVIEASAAAINPKWATRAVLTELMDYVFRHCQMLVGRTAEDNMRVRRLWKAMGAQEYIIPRLRGREASEAVLCITDDAWNQSRLNEARNG